MPEQMSAFESYANYLKTRSYIGHLYRKLFLFPAISNLLRGDLLDVGCGIGDFLAYRPGSVGVDVNPRNVEFCQQRGLNAFQMPFDVIPFKNESFDCVLLDNVLEHVQDPISLLYEIKRVLRSNGILIIGVPGGKGYASDADHKVFYDEATLENLAASFGFIVNRYMYMPLFRSSFLSGNIKQYCIYTQWAIKN